jgi:phosphoribosylformylglycinamidine synthase
MCWAAKDGQEHSNIKANTALKNFFKREDTLSVEFVAATFMELDDQSNIVHGKMLHNDSNKHESILPL